jgi:hypothetical protein
LPFPETISKAVPLDASIELMSLEAEVSEDSLIAALLHSLWNSTIPRAGAKIRP